MRSVSEHQQLALAGVLPLPGVEADLMSARGCILAEDVTAAWPLPSFDNTSMDGYAVHSADLSGATAETPVSLTVVDDVAAGHQPSTRVTPGSVIRIMTGAPLPDGADAVVPVEWTDGGTTEVAISRSVDPGAHIRREGEDVRMGDVVLSRGDALTSRALAVVAASGRGSVRVHPRPRVAVVSTGDELLEPGEPLTRGRIADSNSFMLMAAVAEAGGVPFRAGPVADDEDLLWSVLEAQTRDADLILTSGGVSMGAYDTVKAVLSRLGGVDFVKVAMQPGMPQGLGRLGARGVPIVTLPGNPVSAYVSFEMFVRPVIRRMRGMATLDRPMVVAECASDMTSPAGKTQFARVQLRREGDRWIAYPKGAQGSHILGGLSQADALAVIPPDVTRVTAGDQLTVLDLGRDD